MKKEINILYVFNKRTWPDLLNQLDDLNAVGEPYIETNTVSISTNFDDISFVKDPGNTSNSFKVDKEWLKEKILPLRSNVPGRQYDLIVFHMPTEQWKGGDENGYCFEKIETGFDVTIITTHSHEGELLWNNPKFNRPFFERGQHEKAHATLDILGVPDFVVQNGVTVSMCHVIEAQGGLWKDQWYQYLGLLPNQNEIKISLIKQALAAAYSVLALLQSKLVTGIVWKGSPNCLKGRSGYKPEAIVIHIMEGTLLGTDSWFANPKSVVSAHYGIGKNAAGKYEIHQYVKDEDTAWSVGRVDNPTWSGIKPGINPNLYTLNIEHEGYADSVWPNELKELSAFLINSLAKKWDIPIDRKHIPGHYEIFSKKPNCPAVDKGIIDELIKVALSTY